MTFLHRLAAAHHVAVVHHIKGPPINWAGLSPFVVLTGGALLVLRDAGDAVFGAWMGDGIRPSKGAYYGSGES